MLKRIEVKNFLSFEHSEISVNKKQHTTLVLGNVGSGKSSLFEAICFGLYGYGRADSIAEVRRIGSEGEVFVKLTFEGIKGFNKPLTIVRGLKSDDSGYLQILFDGNILDKGGAKNTTANSAQDTINKIFGLTREEYLLSSFFGLGSNDALFKAYPAEKLDTLQKFIGIDVCNEISTTSLKRSKDSHKNADLVDKEIEVLNKTINDIKDKHKKLKAEIERANNIHTELNKMYVQRVDMVKQEARYQSIVRQASADKLKRDNLVNQHEELLNNLNTAKTGLSVDRKSLNDMIKKRELITSKLSGNNYASVVAKIEKITSRISEINSELVMYGNGDLEGKKSCPLCDAPLDEKHKTEINNKIKSLQTEQNKLRENRIPLKQLQEKMDIYNSNLLKIKNKILSINVEIKEYDSDINSLMKSISVQTTNLKNIDNRVVSNREELRNHTKLMQKLNDIDDSIGTMQITSGAQDQKVKDLRSSYQAQQNTVVKVDNELRPKVSKLRKEALAYKFISDAFSKYNIPNQLLKSVKHIIETKASSIYRLFDNGEIRIDDIPGEKPGIDFYLYTSAGKKPYHLLSTGESVLVYLSVRIAMSMILSNIKNNNIDFLIIDEVAGNLDPDKRDMLAGVINNLLRRMYSQVFVTSHVELPDVFDSTIKIKKQGDISKVIL